MDAHVLQRATRSSVQPRVVVTALAGAPGHDARTAEAHGVAYYRALGADAVAAPDARADPDGALEVLGPADLVVLPGGSPSRLLDALHDTPVGGWLVEAARAGTAVSGSSAGAMVLCAWTVLPDRRGPRGPVVVPGLGVVPGVVVVPHWHGGDERETSWLAAIDDVVPEDVEILGLPEESGVLRDGGVFRAVGPTSARLVRQRRDLRADSSWVPESERAS